MAAREPRSRNSRRGTRHATKDLAEVAMQVAQGCFDDEVAEDRHEVEMPKPTIIESMKAGIKLDPAALLLRLPTPARSASKAMLPSPAPGAGYAHPSMPSPQMQQCYPADLTPMSQMSPISPTWYGNQSFEMPSSPMMQQFSPCMQQQGQSAFMMPQQGYMPLAQQSQGEGWTQQPAQGEQQWGQGGLQAMLMPQACYMDAEAVAKQLQDAAEAAGGYED